MTIERARQLRKNQTEAEKHLWRFLRKRQLDGYYFRRQVPIGPYVVDFACLKQRLIVELDGGQHARQAEIDEKRSRWLRKQRFMGVRFWNHDVLRNIEGVLESIRNSLNDSPPP